MIANVDKCQIIKTILFSVILPFVVNKLHAQEIKGRIYAEGDVSSIYILNTTTQKGTITEEQGFFHIDASSNDTLLISSVQYKNKKIVVSPLLLKQKIVEVYLEQEIIELADVILKPYNLSGSLKSDINEENLEEEVTSKSLKLPNANAKIKTQNERKLYTARTWDFRGTSIKIDPLINIISGRTKMLKNRVALEIKNEKYKQVFESFPKKMMIQAFQIPTDKLYEFFYFCESDKDFDSIVNIKNKGKTWLFLLEKSKEYNILNGKKTNP